MYIYIYGCTPYTLIPFALVNSCQFRVRTLPLTVRAGPRFTVYPLSGYGISASSDLTAIDHQRSDPATVLAPLTDLLTFPTYFPF